MKSKQILSLSLAACLTIGSLAGAGEAQAKAKAKKPVLSKTKMTAYIGKTKTLKVKKNGTKKIVKTKWTLSGKKVAKLSKKKKTSVTIKGLKKGSATVKAKVWYQKKGAKKKKKVTLKCKVSVTKYVSPEAKKKANVLNATTKYQPLAKLAAQHGFKLGTVVNPFPQIGFVAFELLHNGVDFPLLFVKSRQDHGGQRLVCEGHI